MWLYLAAFVVYPVYISLHIRLTLSGESKTFSLKRPQSALERYKVDVCMQDCEIKPSFFLWTQSQIGLHREILHCAGQREVNGFKAASTVRKGRAKSYEREKVKTGKEAVMMPVCLTINMLNPLTSESDVFFPCKWGCSSVSRDKQTFIKCMRMSWSTIEHTLTLTHTQTCWDAC